MEEKRTSLVNRKSGKTGVGQRNREIIREAYAKTNPNLEVIPVKEAEKAVGEPRKLRVCGYCRVSTESENHHKHEIRTFYHRKLCCVNSLDRVKKRRRCKPSSFLFAFSAEKLSVR